jgi:hypothetical protein
MPAAQPDAAPADALMPSAPSESVLDTYRPQSPARALHRTQPHKGESRWRATITALAWLLVVPCLHAIPWLVDGAPWCGLVAIACGLYLATRTGVLGSFWFTWLWSTIAIGAAFYWSPSAMAYTLSSDIGLGIVVATPLILWDGLRLALGYWLAGRLTRNMHAIWLPAALTTIAVETLMPSVFPWRLGFMILPWTEFTQAVDVFGPGWPTFAAFAASGVLLSTATWFIAYCRSGEGTAADSRASHLSARNSRGRHIALGGAIVVGLNLTYGLWATNYWQEQIDKAPKTQVALVQVDPSFTHSLSQSQKLTAAVGGDVDLVCWPESSGGNYELSLNELSDHMKVFTCSREPERGLRPWPSPTCELLLGGKNYIGDRDEPD